MSDIKLKIAQIYAKLKAKNPSIEIRDQQVNLSEEIAQSLDTHGSMFVGEAPTGTGKTIGYLIGALAIQEKLNIPIVIATATVNLQDQILFNDIPKLLDIGLVKETDIMRAKGRGRYYCPLMGEKVIEKIENMAEQGDFFTSEIKTDKKPLRKIDLKEAQHIHSEYQQSTWDGEVDSLPKKPYFWDKVRASSDTCLGKGCKFFDQCQFFKKRKSLSFAKIVIANQDLVLSDLMLAKEDREPILPFKNYLLIIDECHHFPKKALNTATKQVNLTESLVLTQQIPLLNKKIFTNYEIGKTLFSKNIDSEYLQSDQLFDELSLYQNWLVNVYAVNNKMTEDFCIKNILAKDYFSQSKFIKIKSHHKAISNYAKSLEDKLVNIVDAIKNIKGLNKIKDGTNLLFECILILNAIKQVAELFTHFDDKNVNYARWFEKKTVLNKETQEKHIDFYIHLAPIEARSFFKEVLWNTSRAKTAMVSATVATGKRLKESNITPMMVKKEKLNNSDTWVVRDFTPFIHKMNAPAETKVSVFPSVFPYHKSLLEVPQMNSTPKDEGYIKELIVKIREAIHKHNKLGILILFTSKTMMKLVYSALHKEFNMLSQELESDIELINKHKKFIDNKQQSILLGMQKFSEGLDLPGVYCEHLMIARLPFAVPTDPIEEEIKQLDVKGYFQNHVVPETAIKFIQMCGRLIRRSEDIGVISIFDKRLTTTGWGLSLLDSIPDYTKDVENN